MHANLLEMLLFAVDMFHMSLKSIRLLSLQSSCYVHIFLIRVVVGLIPYTSKDEIPATAYPMV